MDTQKYASPLWTLAPAISESLRKTRSSRVLEEGTGKIIYSETSFKGIIEMIMIQSYMKRTSRIKGSCVGNYHLLPPYN